MSEQNINKIYDFLSQNPIQILSTIRDNSPVSRPFGSALLKNGKIWYCMNNDKPTFRDLSLNPNISICVCNANRAWIRICAKANIVDDREIKQVYIDRNIGSFKDSNDPRFAVFYLSDIYAEIHKNGDVEIFS